MLQPLAVYYSNQSGPPAGLDTLEKREEYSRKIGEELHRRGGTQLMARVLDQNLSAYPGRRTIERDWNGIGDWQG